MSLPRPFSNSPEEPKNDRDLVRVEQQSKKHAFAQFMLQSQKQKATKINNTQIRNTNLFFFFAALSFLVFLHDLRVKLDVLFVVFVVFDESQLHAEINLTHYRERERRAAETVRSTKGVAVCCWWPGPEKWLLFGRAHELPLDGRNCT